MPTTYAHVLFGKRVYRKLSAKLQHLIRSNGNLYRIGQHGPDILFYYFISKNPVTQYGVQMHGRKAREFFEKGLPETFRKITASDSKQRKSVPDRTAWSGYPVLLFYIQKSGDTVRSADARTESKRIL